MGPPDGPGNVQPGLKIGEQAGPLLYPDRDQRPGGRWSYPGLVGDILRLAAVERALAHLIAGWVVKVPELDDKLKMATMLEPAIVRAHALRGHALTLLERDTARLVVGRDWIEPLRELDEADDPTRVVEAVLGEILPFLLRRYQAVLARLDPLYDARLLATVRSAVAELQPEGTTVSGRHTAALDAAWSVAAPCLVPLDEALWGPGDRVPVPARPAHRPRPERGARAHLRAMSRLEPDDLAGELNDNVMAELCAMELMSRCSYEHPDMPWAFHIGACRHATDEARHAQMFRRLLAERGFDESALIQHGSNYEYAYEFPECEVGSRRELLWRLLILCTVLEALAIDKLPLEIAIRDTLRQLDVARALDYASTDELFHTENGLRWTRTLCDEHNLDPLIERERVHGRFFGRQRDERARYLGADPERAAREIAILEGPDPDGMTFRSRTEAELRRRASFTDADCEQVDRWGYNG